MAELLIVGGMLGLGYFLGNQKEEPLKSKKNYGKNRGRILKKNINRTKLNPELTPKGKQITSLKSTILKNKNHTPSEYNQNTKREITGTENNGLYKRNLPAHHPTKNGRNLREEEETGKSFSRKLRNFTGGDSLYIRKKTLENRFNGHIIQKAVEKSELMDERLGVKNGVFNVNNELYNNAYKRNYAQAQLALQSVGSDGVNHESIKTAPDEPYRTMQRPNRHGEYDHVPNRTQSLEGRTGGPGSNYIKSGPSTGKSEYIGRDAGFNNASGTRGGVYKLDTYTPGYHTQKFNNKDAEELTHKGPESFTNAGVYKKQQPGFVNRQNITEELAISNVHNSKLGIVYTDAQPVPLHRNNLPEDSTTGGGRSATASMPGSAISRESVNTVVPIMNSTKGRIGNVKNTIIASQGNNLAYASIYKQTLNNLNERKGRPGNKTSQITFNQGTERLRQQSIPQRDYSVEGRVSHGLFNVGRGSKESKTSLKSVDMRLNRGNSMVFKNNNSHNLERKYNLENRNLANSRMDHNLIKNQLNKNPFIIKR